MGKKRKIRVWVRARGDDGSISNLGHVDLEADTLDEAFSEAYNELWDTRLDSASCTAQYDYEWLEDEEEQVDE